MCRVVPWVLISTKFANKGRKGGRVVGNSRFLWVVASSEMACPRQANSSLPRLQIASRLAINSGAGWARQRGRVRRSLASEGRMRKKREREDLLLEIGKKF